LALNWESCIVQRVDAMKRCCAHVSDISSGIPYKKGYRRRVEGEDAPESREVCTWSDIDAARCQVHIPDHARPSITSRARPRASRRT